MKIIYLAAFVAQIFFGSAHASDSRYRIEEFCDEGKIVRCLVGPYAYECDYTGLSCLKAESSNKGSRCFDPRVELFQCEAGKEFIRWNKGDCEGGFVEGAVCN